MTPADPTPLWDLPAEVPGGRRRVLCSVCGAPLTGRVARLWGMGRDCRAKLGLRTGPRQDGHEVEQDGLFG